jgi:hypothetical protein
VCPDTGSSDVVELVGKILLTWPAFWSSGDEVLRMKAVDWTFREETWLAECDEELWSFCCLLEVASNVACEPVGS